jgi:3-oxoacyl-(acyl-carrier-protein) synthase
MVPPTIGLEEEDEVCRLNYVKGKAQSLDCEYAPFEFAALRHRQFSY